ncbi:hypothetical protein [Nonomuraea endophytica]|uniref:Uncharacterized protein n=1 Tax=Nonomuraea endophytica TaxID=714136 RepID=A0A7W8AG96_9ACTN|nr:hypothetical protein [Nonomuraea endophytica]MBB5084561.1 hypothetical protein [Nonomuraea endophytica]
MKGFFTGISRREKQFAVAGIVIALVFFMPFLAMADPGSIPGSEPSGTRPSSAQEKPLDVKQGDSCKDVLPADTPSYVVCEWLTPPQDAAKVAAFWAADGGANFEKAQPLPQNYVRCNQKTDLSKEPNCRGGQTFCEELPSGWYKCTNMVNNQVTYEKYVDGKKQVLTSPPPDAMTPANRDNTDRAPSDSGTTDPGTTDSRTTDPGRTDSRTTDPGRTDPGTTDPGTTDPGTTDSRTTDPGTTDPGTTDPGNGDTGETGRPAVPSPTPSNELGPGPTVRSAAPVGTAITAASKAGLRIWVENDLADDFRAGDAQFRAAVAKLVTAAKRPGVVGVKFADYLGFRDFTSAAQVKQFVAEATKELRAKLPGKRLAMGVVVPELGCGQAEQCVADMRSRYPLVTRSRVDDYIRTSGVDRVYVASGLFGKSYSGFKVTLDGQESAITPAIAAQAQWMAVKALGWDAVVQIGSREYGLTHSGQSSPWAKERAQAEVDARVGNAIGLGAQTVTLWGHRISYDADHRRILDAGLAPNAVWQALIGKGMRERLSVLFDPGNPEVSVSADIQALAKGVSEIFVLV